MKYQGGERRIRFVLYILISTSLWSLGFFVTKAVSSGELLISRLQITGGTGKTDNDFITVYNNSSTVIDLYGFRLVKRTASGTSDTTLKSWIEPTLLNPGAYYMWANSNNGFATLMQANTFSSQTIANDNGVAIRFGGENSGEIIDSVGWGNATNIFVETNPYITNPVANQTLERINNQDSNNNSLDFHATPTVFPSACGNNIVESGEQCDDGNIINGDGCNSLCQTETTDICGNGNLETGEGCDDGNIINNDGCSSVCQLEMIENAEVYINEFVSDPVSGSNEWVELYTPNIVNFSLTDWSLEDGAGTKTRLIGSIGGSNKFFVVEKPNGSLNNSGDNLILRNQAGEIVNQITYGDWDDDNSIDNAPTTTDPNSVARKQDGVVSGNDSFDFAITTTPTKGGANTITVAIIEEEIEDTVSSDIVVSEVFPNPIGVDSSAINGEFIELYNQGDTLVNLGGWHIEIGSKEYVYELTNDISIKAKSYILLSNSYYKLPNSGSAVKLFQPGKTTSYQTVTYKEANEGESWILIQEQQKNVNKIWQWTEKPTPKANNVLISGPKANFDVIGELTDNQVLLFDSSDSQISGAKTTFSWNFGDGKTSLEQYPQHVFVKAGTYTVAVTIKNEYGSSTLAKKLKITTSENDTITTTSSNIEMEEISLDAQSIRINEILPNPSGKDDSREWIELFNSSGNPVLLQGWRIATHNKKGKVIESEIIIKPQSLLLLPKEFIPILSNNNETIQLLASDESIIDSVSYTTAPDNQSYAFVNNEWNWTTKLTPGEENSIINTKGVVTAEDEEGIISVTGIVVSLPGTFSTQYFHLKPEGSETLLQIYNSKKLFPKLGLNQKITVRGEIITAASGSRLKTSEASDITVNNEGNEIEIPLSLSSQINQPPYPRLAKVEGEVTSKKSPRLIITDAQGDTEIYFVKGSNLSIARFNIGDKLTVTGILELSGTAPRLMPRNEQDIFFHNTPQAPETTTNAENINSELVANTRNPKKQLFTYLILGAVFVIGGGSYILWKYYGKK